jgi:hypothetical protein
MTPHDSAHTWSPYDHNCGDRQDGNKHAIYVTSETTGFRIQSRAGECDCEECRAIRTQNAIWRRLTSAPPCDCGECRAIRMQRGRMK